jgi:DNA-binding Lrp family transcriptional regulator
LSFHGRQLQVGFYYRNEKALARQISLMESICGCKGSMLWNVSFPPFRLKMSRTDWIILDALRKDPRTKLSDLAREVKVSTRTLNRRLEQMIQGYVFFLHAAIDLKKLGGLACRMLLYCEDPVKKRIIDDSILTKFNKIEWMYTVSNQYSMFVMHCENTAEAEGISSWVKSLEGVREVRMDIIEEQITVSEWLEEEIEMHLSQAH